MKALIYFVNIFSIISQVRSAEYGDCILGQCFPESSNVKDGDIFDYLIIGAGSAGSILATRLTELKDATVLLIEAGGDPPIASVIPGQAFQTELSSVDWAYTTINDSHSSQALKNGQVTVNRGKMLGGTGSMNWMLHARGNQHDYDKDWYKALGNEFKYQALLPYFKKLENVTSKRILHNSGSKFYRGTSGPIKVTNTDNSVAVTEVYLKAFEEVGVYFNNDFNAASQMGIGILDTNIFDGIRQSSLIAYLNPVVGRKNLFVLKNSLVTKVIIDKETKTALGVEIKTESGKCITTYAYNEVIVSAGVINTPQLLMLSGIGPCEQLREFKIDCLSNLLVGQNLQDHMAVLLFVSFEKEIQGSVDPELILQEYLQNRTGRLATSPANTISSFVSLTNSSYPDFQTILTHYSKNTSDALNSCIGIGLSEKICENSIDNDKEISILSMSLQRPKSRGQVLLASDEPTVYPQIYTGYFSSEDDLARAALSVMKIVELISSEPFKEYGPKFLITNINECIHLIPYSYEFWKCFCLNTVIPSCHLVGTAKMGKIEDRTSVVDTNFNVIGINSLRVVDASVMPTITSSNINNVVEMVAEKAADKIKERYILLQELRTTKKCSVYH